MKIYKYLALILAVSVITNYLPVMLYWAYRVGIWDGPSQSFLPVVLVENQDWFPVVTSESEIGKSILGRKKMPPSVLYQKVNYATPWNSRRVLVSSFRLPSTGGTDDIFSGRLKLTWGSVDLVRPEVSRVGSYRVALETEHGIGFLYQDTEDLLAFESVRTRSKAKGQSEK